MPTHTVPGKQLNKYLTGFSLICWCQWHVWGFIQSSFLVNSSFGRKSSISLPYETFFVPCLHSSLFPSLNKASMSQLSEEKTCSDGQSAQWWEQIKHSAQLEFWKWEPRPQRAVQGSRPNSVRREHLAQRNLKCSCLLSFSFQNML